MAKNVTQIPELAEINPSELETTSLSTLPPGSCQTGHHSRGRGSRELRKDTSNFIQMRLRLCVGEGALLPWDEDPGGFPFVFQTMMFQPLIFCGWWP